MMKRILLWCLATIPLLMASPLRADQFSFQNNFSFDDDVFILGFSLTAPGVVTLQTFGYAGGMNGAGSIVAAGGFDPLLTLFDGAGNFLVSNNDGACGLVGTDAATLNCFDAYLSLILDAGDYSVVLTENDNLPVGPTLADSFSHVGSGNFTCAEFMGSSGGFCDASPSQRGSAWALDIVTPSAVPMAPVPEPDSATLVLSGLGFFMALRSHFYARWRSL